MVIRGYGYFCIWLGFIFFLLVLSAGYAFNFEGQVIALVETQGNFWIDSKTILHTIKTAPGQSFSSILIRKDIKALYRLGFFETIEVEVETRPDMGLVVIFRVKEKPLITEILIKGNKKLPSDKLRERLTLKTRTILDETKVKRNATLLEHEYKLEGFQDAHVEPVIEKIKENEIRVTFEITEGLEVAIKEIKFIGNTFYSSKKLRKQMKTKTYHGLLSIFSNRGKFNEQKLQEDIASVEEFYQDNGFIKVNIGQYKVEKIPITADSGKKVDKSTINEKNTKDKKKRKKKKKLKRRFIRIIVPLTEGDRYKFGRIIIDGVKVFSKDKIMDQIQKGDVQEEIIGGYQVSGIFGKKKRKVLKEGEYYSRKLVRDATSAIADMYGEKGYISVNTYPDIQIHDDTKTVDITFVISEGVQHFLRRMEFSGNNRTRDKVLRRELKIVEKEIFNTKKLRRSLASLYYLGFLENIDTRVEPDKEDPSQMDLTILVSDTRRDTLNFGGGFSAATKYFGQFGFSSRNILGMGLEGEFNVRVSKYDQSYYISLTNRYLMDSNWFGRFTVFNQKRDLNEFNRNSRGGALTIGKYLNKDRSILFRTRYLFEVVEVELDRDVDDPLLLESEGVSSTSSINPSITRDTRDNRRDPAKGSWNNLSFEIAGSALGGDNAFYKISYDHKWFYPLFKFLIFGFRGQIRYGNGYDGKSYPVFERFFLGGERSVRIFDIRSIGPKADNGRTVGGNKLLLFNTELLIPIYRRDLKFVLFLDMGDVYGKEENYSLKTLRKSVGAEIRFTIPNFWLPLRLIYGYNIDRYRGERANDFQFSIGTTF